MPVCYECPARQERSAAWPSIVEPRQEPARTSRSDRRPNGFQGSTYPASARWPIAGLAVVPAAPRGRRRRGLHDRCRQADHLLQRSRRSDLGTTTGARRALVRVLAPVLSPTADRSRTTSARWRSPSASTSPSAATTHIVERPDGTRASVVPYPTVLEDADGNVVGAINVIIDVTEQRRAEAAATAASAARDEFLRLVSHETPDTLSRPSSERQLLGYRGDPPRGGRGDSRRHRERRRAAARHRGEPLDARAQRPSDGARR